MPDPGGPPDPRATLRAVAAADVALTAPFAVPVLAGWIIAALADLDAWLGLGNDSPALDPLGLLFVNLTGVLAVCWNLARVGSAGTELARIDVPARCVVAALIAGYVGGAGVSPLLLVFVATELGGAVLQARALLRAARAGTPS